MMRNTLLIILGFLFFGSLSAQSLTFSRVLQVYDVEDTVPAGKVWKVESYWQANTSFYSEVATASCPGPDDQEHHPFWVDNNDYYTFEGSPGTGAANRWTAPGNTFPLWLPAGARLRTSCPDDFLSVIEFNSGP